MSATKQRSSAGKKVAIFFIVFMILEGLLIFGVNFVFKNKDVTPSLAGYSMYIMDTDAMGDDVPKGALVLAANGAPSKEGIGKAVLCEDVPGVGTSVFWLAYISNSADNSGPVYTVIQNRDPSRLYDLKTKNIVGTATSYYVTAGKIITFMTSKFGIIALIAVPLFLLVLLELIIMIVNHSRSDYDDDEDEDEDDEDEKPVKLDDFLFGGDNDKKLIEDSIHQGEEAAAELTDNKAPAKTVDPDEIWAAPKKHKVKIEEPEEEKPEPVKEEAPEEEAAKPAIDPSYYEKASKLIDGEKAEAEQPTEEPAPKPAAKKTVKKSSSDNIKFTKKTSSKLKSTSFEDLMKMMEEESNKLNDKLKK